MLNSVTNIRSGNAQAGGSAAAPVAQVRPRAAAAPAAVPGHHPAPAPAPSVVLDLADVTALDAAGVATLAEACATARAAGRSFALANPSPRVLDALRAGPPELVASVRQLPALHVVPEPPPVDCEALIRDHRDLADRLAARFAGRGQPFEDLKQVAYLGLVTAAQRFDPGRAVQFKTYAQATIAGELKRHFRDHAWQLHVARPVQELYLAVRAASEEMTHAGGRTPTPAELAKRLGVTEEQVVESLEVRSALRVESLDAPRDGDDDVAPWRNEAVVEEGYRTVEERSWLVPALQALSERERHIVKLRFFDGLAQSAIAAEVGISQMHVSRLLARALETLRAAANE
ncbi:MAG TPA: sigma-70 family RNA polymerase sigma factor [Frankiaceae bacterium]|nr:sigma-70 family RNA polymerase sigma factor [Frankiaceae bacterium]